MGDLLDLVHENTAKMVIKNHQGDDMNGDKGAMSITFYGPDTVEQRRAYAKHRTALIEAGDDAEQKLGAECQFLTDAARATENVIYDGKEVLIGGIKKIFHDVLAIRAQALVFIGTDANFTKELEKS